MIYNLPPLKDEYGPCDRLIADCYLHKEKGVLLEELSVGNCIECTYNLKKEKTFKPNSNELEDRVNENDK